MKSNCIFVSVASYRDAICSDTIKSLFEMAHNPENIFIGVCQQNKEGDYDCVENINEKWKKNVKIIRLSHNDAKGPTYARYLCSTLWEDEEFYFQIDSHTNCVKNWDIKCIDMINEIKMKGLSRKPVLSYYPRELVDYKDYKEEVDRTVLPRICKPFFNTRDMISFMGSELIDSKDEYYFTPFSAGGMIFCESYFLKELPYDPNLPYVFVGEEILHSIRFYTHGWDIFTPKENIVFHKYTRKDEPKIWTDNPYYSDMDGFTKIKYIIGLEKDLDKVKPEMRKDIELYGLGKVRTIEDYYKLTNIDIENRTVSSNFCRDNNIGSVEDIQKSNEKNWSVEKYTSCSSHSFKKNKIYYIALFLFLFLILCLIISLIILIYNTN